jgi:hypothetical protein
MDLFVEEAARRYGIRPELLGAMFNQESRFNPRARSNKGAMGIGQLMPGTAREVGVTDPWDPWQNIQGSAKYLREQFDTFGGDERLALAAYNAGPGAVKKYGGVPPYHETQNYIKKILGSLNPMSTAQASETSYGQQPSDDEMDLFKQAGVEPPQLAGSQPTISQPSTNPPGDDEMDLFKQAGVEPPQGSVALTPMGSDQPLNPAEMSPPSKFLAGAGMPFIDLYKGFKQAYNLGDKDQLQQEIEANRRASEGLGGWGTAGAVTGSLAVPTPASVPAALGLAGLYGALQPTAEGDDEAGARLKSGIASAALPGVLAGAGRAIKGFTPSRAAKEFMDAGVQPTVGQGIEQGALGRQLRKMEEASTATPLFGALTEHARNRGGKEWLQAVFKKASDKTLGITAQGKVGQEGVELMRKSFNKAYTKNLEGHTIPIRTSLLDDIESAIKDQSRYMDDADRLWADGFIAKQFDSIDMLPDNTVKALDLRKIETAISEKVRALSGKQDIKASEQGALLDEVEDIISQYRTSLMPAKAAENIKKLDTKYAMFKRIQKAQSTIGAKEVEGFTPAQLKNAALQMDKSVTARSEGRALMQDIAQRGQEIFGNTLGESGTAPRTMMGKILGGGGGEAAAGFLLGIPKTAALLSIEGLGSTRAGQKAMLGGYRWQPKLSEMAMKYARRGALPAAFFEQSLSGE